MAHEHEMSDAVEAAAARLMDDLAGRTEVACAHVCVALGAGWRRRSALASSGGVRSIEVDGAIVWRCWLDGGALALHEEWLRRPDGGAIEATP